MFQVICIGIFFAAVSWYFVSPSHSTAEEVVTTGMFYDPLYWGCMVLLVGLFGLIAYIHHVHQTRYVPPVLFIAAAGIIAVVMFMRRQLKRHYGF